MSDSTSSRKAFKLWFDGKLVEELSAMLSEAAPKFDGQVFREEASAGLDEKEMKERVVQIADAMAEAMPWSTKRRMRALIDSLPPVLKDVAVENGYRFWPYGEFIAQYGLDDVDASFEAMVELTMRFSSEFAVRPFLKADIDDALNRLEKLVDHENLHVRRWVSEGTRSRLPWAKNIAALQREQPRRIELLSKLRYDHERYVQRSVANHLQDILKDDEATGLDILVAWAEEEDHGVQWIIKHASRGLLKKGHPKVMALFGYRPSLLEIEDFDIQPKEVSIGDEIELSLTLKNESAKAVLSRVDFALIRPTKSGKMSRKVFRWADCTLEAGESEDFQKSYSFVHRSTRRVYAGEHRLEAIINGVISEDVMIEVKE